MFREDCLRHDIPRLAAEVLPDGVEVEADLEYMPGLKLDIYRREDTPETMDEAFILIHGGAFVYGAKENDKNFGMRLALRSGIPVVNIDYTLMPDANIERQVADIDNAILFSAARLGLKSFHVTGDSAGGYLALLTAIRHETAKSVSVICGFYELDMYEFPGYFFDSDDGLYYDLSKGFDKLRGKRMSVVTGEKDYLRKDNIALAGLLGGDCVFYDAGNCDGREMTHVYPISHPEWPEGQKVIDIVARTASGS